MNGIARLLFGIPLALAALAASAQAPTVAEDPPERAGRLSLVEGGVLWRQAGAAAWEDAEPNWPVTSGDRLLAMPGSRAELRIGSSVVHVAGDTELEVARLADGPVHLRLEDGSLALRVRSLDPEAAFVVETRDGLARVLEPGHYRVDVLQGATALTAWHGRIEFEAPDSRAMVPTGQRVDVWNAGRTEYRWSGAERDDFYAWSLARDERDDALELPRHVSPEMTGAEELSLHGEWEETYDYGAVWYPRHVSETWAPYRYGRWIWVEPWGWTWLDDAPWGFAPFHYGRWVILHGRWAWVPGAYAARPVYAPALVVWIGSPGWQIGFSSGYRPAVGWFPLAPHEVYVPYFRASPRFVQRVNVTHVTRVTRIVEVHKAPHRARFAHRDRFEAVTVVPAEDLRHGRRFARHDWRDGGRTLQAQLPLATAAPSRREDTTRFGGERQSRVEAERRLRRDSDERLRTERMQAPQRRAEPARLAEEPAREVTQRRVQPRDVRERERAVRREAVPLSREAGTRLDLRRGEETRTGRSRERAADGVTSDPAAGRLGGRSADHEAFRPPRRWEPAARDAGRPARDEGRESSRPPREWSRGRDDGGRAARETTPRSFQEGSRQGGRDEGRRAGRGRDDDGGRGGAFSGWDRGR